MISSPISQISIGGAKIIKFLSLAIDGATGADVDKKGNSNDNPVMVSATP